MKRPIFRGLGLAGLALMSLVFLAYVGMFVGDLPIGTYRQAHAVVVGGDLQNGGHYWYQYRVGDRLCRGVADLSYEPGTSITVHYNPKDVCVSDARDPGAVLWGDAIVLLLLGPYVWVAAAGVLRPFRRTGRPTALEVAK